MSKFTLDENLQFIWQELMNEPARAASKVTLVYILIGAALSIIAPYGIGLIIDGVSSRSIDTLILGMMVYIGLEITSHGIAWLRMRVRELMFQYNFWHIPYRITELFSDRPLSKLLDEDNEVDGGSVDSLKDHVWNVIKAFSFTIISNYAYVTFGIIISFVVQPLLGMLVLIYVVIEIYLGNTQNQHMRAEMKPVIEGFKRWERRIREWWNATPLIKSNGVERRICTQVHDEVQDPLRGDDAVWRVYYPRKVYERRFIGLAFQVGVYALAAHYALVGDITTEAFVLLFFSFGRIIMALQEISDIQREVQRGLATINKYREKLTEPLAFRYDEGKEFTDNTIGVTFDRVSLTLGTNGNRRTVLRDVSFIINPGERVGIVGPSGAGKSQLVSLILRGTDPTSGRVCINDADLRDLSLQTFTRNLGIVPQKSELFEDSVLGNVVFGVSHLEWKRLVLQPDARERVTTALNRAGLDFEGRLTDGLDTKIGYKGMRLSGGQQQRLMIAQAHFKEPKMIIADEATASLDSVSESKVIDHLYDSLPDGTTVMMIAHRLSTLNRCEKIIFVRPLDECDESMQQVTTHTSMVELYAAEALFREMADAQGFRP